MDERDEIIEALKEWANTHPNPDRVFCAELEGGSLAFTPKQYLDEVERGTPFGKSVLEFLIEQGRVFTIEPAEFIRRATRNHRTRSHRTRIP